MAKTKNTSNFEEMDLINPKDFSLEEVQTLINTTDQELKQLYKEENALTRQIRGKLWLWWFLPIFGFMIYLSFLNRKKESPKWAQKQVVLKRKIAKKEIQQIFNKKRLDQLNKPN